MNTDATYIGPRRQRVRGDVNSFIWHRGFTRKKSVLSSLFENPRKFMLKIFQPKLLCWTRLQLLWNVFFSCCEPEDGSYRNAILSCEPVDGRALLGRTRWLRVRYVASLYSYPVAGYKYIFAYLFNMPIWTYQKLNQNQALYFSECMIYIPTYYPTYYFSAFLSFSRQSRHKYYLPNG